MCGLFWLWTSRVIRVASFHSVQKCLCRHFLQTHSTQFSPWFEMHTSSMTTVQNNIHKMSHWMRHSIHMTSSHDLVKLQPLSTGFRKCGISHGWGERGVFNRGPTRVLDPLLRSSGSLPSRAFYLKAVITAQANCVLLGVSDIEDSDCCAKRVYIVEIRFSCDQMNSQL